MKSIELIVRVIINRDSKILLCKNKVVGNFYLQGGHVEFGDTLEKTIYKEMNEELGLEKEQITNIEYKNYLENSYIKDNENFQELNMIFNIKIPNDLNLTSQEDHIDFEWIEIENIKNIRLLPEQIVPLIL